ncbi:MAG: hypothetical protein DMG38_19595 [Acidobacteria bacterium]|nr:MAG: hypothetical protein DMG38_19595 [Acidobacteriota bacterium]
MWKCASPHHFSKLVVPTFLLSTLPMFILRGGKATQPISNQAQRQSSHQAKGDAGARSHHTVDRQSPTSQRTLLENYGKLPLSFEANLGQIDSSVKFLSQGRGYTLFLRGDEAVLVLRNANGGGEKSKSRRSDLNVSLKSRALDLLHLPGSELDNNSASREPRSETPSGESQTPEVLRMRLVGANRAVKVKGVDELPGKSNYFIGMDPMKWRTNVPTYAKVKYEGVYPGIDLVYYGHQRQLEYDFVVAAEANPKTIRLEIENRNSKIGVDGNGDLVVGLTSGEVRLHKPHVYQPSDPNIESTNSPLVIQNAEFVVANNCIGLDIPSYDKTKPLIIDPILVYSSYVGGSGADWGNSIAVDSSGNAYVTGAMHSTDFPTVNALQPASGGGYEDVFVVKINPAGNALVYSTYLGGSYDDAASGMSVDSSGSAYVTGTTDSPDFPTANAVQAHLASTVGPNAFVAKFSPDGSALVYSTYLGGSSNDHGNAITVDTSGNAYVTGLTQSLDFPTTAGAFQTICGCNSDAFVTKFSADGTRLAYSTYLGGGAEDQGNSVAVDLSGSAYITGATLSSDFPTTNGAFESTSTGGAFVTKVNAAGTALVYSTYLGNGGDQGYGIAVDSSANAYVTGQTILTNFPTTNGAFQSTFGGYYDAFVTKLNAAGSDPVYSTYLGGSDYDFGYGIAVDSFGNAYVVGTTSSGDFPSKQSFKSCAGAAGPDVFVSNLNARGNALLYSTCLGGTDENQGRSIAVDSFGEAYITGFTFAGDFPLVNPFGTGHGGEPDSDAFVAKIARSRTTNQHAYRSGHSSAR